MADRLFKRDATVTISRSSTADFFRTTTSTLIEGLRVSFSIEKTLDPEPNMAEVIVFNLGEATRAELERRPVRVRVDAGYDGDLARIVEGDVFFADQRREGTEWISRLQIGDGLRAFKHARVGRSFAFGTKSKDLISEIAGSMGLSVPKSVSEAKTFASQLVSGTVVEGPSHAELTRILRPKGYGWSIQDGRLQILADGAAKEGTALVLSEDTGLVGSPGFGAPTEPGKKPILTAQMLLYPQMSPGSKLQLESQSIRGLFRVQSARHFGDTEGKDWYTQIEATAI